MGSRSVCFLLWSCVFFSFWIPQSGEAESAFAADFMESPPEDMSKYYLIHDPSRRPLRSFDLPAELSPFAQMIRGLQLLRFDFFDKAFPAPREPYQRRAHFGDWVDDPRDQNCYDSRAKVLIRDSSLPVVLRRNNRCVVDGGLWHEPYAGRSHRLAKDVQVDHLVALKNAYQTGAAAWDWPARCLYANFLGNDFHLVAVDARENMRKGARSPAQWMPPNPAVACAYLGNWLKTKIIWGLALSVAEGNAIQELVRRFRCESGRFIFDERELARQRRTILANLDLCSRMKKR